MVQGLGPGPGNPPGPRRHDPTATLTTTPTAHPDNNPDSNPDDSDEAEHT